jgi:hypothetical protein
VSTLEPANAADVDDAAGAIRGHVGNHRLRDAQHAERLGVDVVAPVRIRPLDLALGPFDRPARVVDEDVQRAELAARPFD